VARRYAGGLSAQRRVRETHRSPRRTAGLAGSRAFLGLYPLWGSTAAPMLATQGTTIAKHSAHDKLRCLIPYSGANALGQSALAERIWIIHPRIGRRECQNVAAVDPSRLESISGAKGAQRRTCWLWKEAESWHFLPAGAGHNELTLANPPVPLTEFIYIISLHQLSATWHAQVQADGGDKR
jgi:hypothetical protein